jgi:hypothetical protein
MTVTMRRVKSNADEWPCGGYEALVTEGDYMFLSFVYDLTIERNGWDSSLDAMADEIARRLERVA